MNSEIGVSQAFMQSGIIINSTFSSSTHNFYGKR
jgi:hypothetical protein